MKVGEFNEWLIIEKPDPEHAEVDAYGRRTVPWREVTRMYGSARDVSGRDYWEAAAHQLQDTVTLTVRWHSQIDASCRLKWQDEYWQVDQVNHLGYRRDFLRIRARRVKAVG